MDEHEHLAREFETHRTWLRAVTGRTLGSNSEADDPMLLAAQREVIAAFIAAAREADFDGLVALLDPDAVLRADRGAARAVEVRGAEAIARGARGYARLAPYARPALINGAAGFVVVRNGRPIAVAGVTIARGRIVEIEVLRDPARLRELELPA